MFSGRSIALEVKVEVDGKSEVGGVGGDEAPPGGDEFV